MRSKRGLERERTKNAGLDSSDDLVLNNINSEWHIFANDYYNGRISGCSKSLSYTSDLQKE